MQEIRVRAKMAMKVGIVSECFIQPHHALEDSKHPFYLTPWDLYFINSQSHTQKGLLFAKPHPQIQSHEFMNSLLDRLKQSLSLTLTHFYPLAGRLRTIPHENEYYSFYVDCNDSPGVKFIYATSDVTVSDILSPIDVPTSVLQIFYHDDRALLDLHAKSLVTITVTELVDGVFIGCAMNHIVADGNSFCHFLNMWSEIFQSLLDQASINGSAGFSISRPPILERWFPDGYGPIVKLPYAYQNTHVSVSNSKSAEAPKCKARIFHLSSETVAKLKTEAKTECNNNNNNDMIIISSLQSLSAFLWRSITKARRLPSDQKIILFLPANNRSRLNPPLSPDYFGNAVGIIVSEIITAGELLQHDLGWAAWKLHQGMAGHSDKEIRQWLDVWLKSPRTLTGNDLLAGVCTLGINDFTKFNTMDNEFGMGKPLAFCSGNRKSITDGNMIFYSGRQPGSIDLELILLSETMSHLESDSEFMEIVSA